jgi:hypothetical protein
MFAQSKPYPEMIELIAQLKVRHGLKIALVSNEAHELDAHRIHKFKLTGLVNSFISSSFVHPRKLDQDLFRLALDITDASPASGPYRRDPDVRRNRGRSRNSRYRANGLRVHVRETGFVGIAGQAKTHP